MTCPRWIPILDFIILFSFLSDDNLFCIVNATFSDSEGSVKIDKRGIYLAFSELSGIFYSMLGKKSSYRVKIP